MIDSNRFHIDFYLFFKKTTSCFIFLLLLFNTSYSQNKVWEQTNGPIGGSPEVFCDNKSGYIFCGNGEGLFRSSNNGNTWERILIANQNIGVDDMVNSINNKLYVVADKNLYRSIDNGETWEKTPAFIHGIKISPDNILYGWRFSMMTKSIDDGLSWEIIYQGDFYSRSISKVFIDSRGFIYYTKESQVGSFTISKDQGSSWKTIYLDKSDALVLSFLEVSNGKIIVSTTKGFISSKDMSNSWVWNEGNGNNYFPSLLQYDGINNIYGLTNKGIAHSSDNGETWLENNVELNLMIRLFLSNNGYLFISDMKSGIYRSKPPSFIFTPAQDGFINTKIQSLVITTKGELVASTLTSGIHLSGNGGESWLKFVNENDITYPNSLCVLSSDKIVFGTSDKVFYTSTDISALINITDNLPYFSSLLDTYLNEIFAYTNYGFFKRDLSSDQWEFISNEIPKQDNNFRSLDIDQKGYFYLFILRWFISFYQWRDQLGKNL